MINHYLGKSKSAFVRSKMEPKALYKATDLKKDFRTGEIRLVALCFREDEGGISVNAEAQCHVTREPLKVTLGERTWTLYGGGPDPCKETPARSCRCGFHAYNEYAPARDHDQGGQFVVRVVGSGKMFEYKQGYRYGHQRLEEVIVGSCGVCAHHADRLVVGGTGNLIPLCGNCTRRREPPTSSLMSFSELEEAASKGLPPNAPRITIRSENVALVPWERPVKKSGNDQKPEKNNSQSKRPYLSPEDVWWGVFVILAGTPSVVIIMDYLMNQ